MQPIAFISILVACLGQSANVRLTPDGLDVARSCRIVVPPDLVLSNTDKPLIRISASDITIEFANDVVLRGAPTDMPPNEFQGVAIRIDGHRNVTIRRARLSGFRCAIHATRADGLTVEDVEAVDMGRLKLWSNAATEDLRDWLRPHVNDDGEWFQKYGGAIVIERSRGTTVRGCRVQQGQNALILDRTSDSRVYDNDFSFHSGWGVALWRSSRNTISRNAIDFCVRGYSHGAYNRGQDSAGILLFEQSSENTIAENSVTHCGDAYFSYAGHEALGWNPSKDPDFTHRRAGCNDNLLIRNDFSDSAAHGVEITFSFGNRVIENRITGNAITGIWAGYSRDTLIYRNTFEHNGIVGIGHEHGAISIERGRNNQILQNDLRGNACGIRLWQNEECKFAATHWGKANPAAEGNEATIARNQFNDEPIGISLRGPVTVAVAQNNFETLSDMTSIDKSDDAIVQQPIETPQTPDKPDVTIFGSSQPIGSRAHLRGLERIVMTEWGPWDHASPLVRLLEAGGRTHTYELRNVADDVTMTVTGDGVRSRTTASGPAAARKFVVEAQNDGVYSYRLAISGRDLNKTFDSTLLAIDWNAMFFRSEVDPREELDSWRSLATGPTAVSVKLDALDLRFSSRGPGDLNLSKELTDAAMGRDKFGLIAETTLPMTKGDWRIVTTSDDGVRVIVDGKAVIEDWTHHVTRRGEAVIAVERDRPVHIVVEYFELDGFATLQFDLERVQQSSEPLASERRP